MAKYILAGDIGGTNPRLAMLDESGRIVFKRDIGNEGKSIVPLLNDFLREAAGKGYTTDTCCISVAGPVENNKCHSLANARYQVDDEEIRRGSLLRNILVINDFAAIGAAVARLHTDDPCLKQLTTVQTKPRADPAGSRAIVGPGTGLGVAYLPRFDKGYLVLPSEGGHSYVPYIAEHRGLLEHIRLKLGADQIDMESLVSGQGIRHAVRFFLDHPHALAQLVNEHHHFHSEAAMLKKPSDKRAEDAIRHALDNERNNPTIDAAAVIARSVDTCVAARVAMRVFARFLGAAAQDVALHGLAYGGVFIAGGIAAKNVELLNQGDFMHAFFDNQRPTVRELLRKIPVFVVVDYDISFVGCFAAANRAFPSQ